MERTLCFHFCVPDSNGELQKVTLSLKFCDKAGAEHLLREALTKEGIPPRFHESLVRALNTSIDDSEHTRSSVHVRGASVVDEKVRTAHAEDKVSCRREALARAISEGATEDGSKRLAQSLWEKNAWRESSSDGTLETSSSLHCLPISFWKSLRYAVCNSWRSTNGSCKNLGAASLCDELVRIINRYARRMTSLRRQWEKRRENLVKLQSEEVNLLIERDEDAGKLYLHRQRLEARLRRQHQAFDRECDALCEKLRKQLAARISRERKASLPPLPSSSAKTTTTRTNAARTIGKCDDDCEDKDRVNEEKMACAVEEKTKDNKVGNHRVFIKATSTKRTESNEVDAFDSAALWLPETLVSSRASSETTFETRGGRWQNGSDVGNDASFGKERSDFREDGSLSSSSSSSLPSVRKSRCVKYFCGPYQVAGVDLRVISCDDGVFRCFEHPSADTPQGRHSRLDAIRRLAAGGQFVPSGDSSTESDLRNGLGSARCGLRAAVVPFEVARETRAYEKARSPSRRQDAPESYVLNSRLAARLDSFPELLFPRTSQQLRVASSASREEDVAVEENSVGAETPARVLPVSTAALLHDTYSAQLLRFENIREGDVYVTRHSSFRVQLLLHWVPSTSEDSRTAQRVTRNAFATIVRRAAEMGVTELLVPLPSQSSLRTLRLFRAVLTEYANAQCLTKPHASSGISLQYAMPRDTLGGIRRVLFVQSNESSEEDGSSNGSIAMRLDSVLGSDGAYRDREGAFECAKKSLHSVFG
eukprot:g499.t1